MQNYYSVTYLVIDTSLKEFQVFTAPSVDSQVELIGFLVITLDLCLYLEHKFQLTFLIATIPYENVRQKPSSSVISFKPLAFWYWEKKTGK